MTEKPKQNNLGHHSFFGKIDTINCFRDFLTFNAQSTEYRFLFKMLKLSNNISVGLELTFKSDNFRVEILFGF